MSSFFEFKEEFNELASGERLFKLNEKEVINYVKSQIRHNSMIDIFASIISYMSNVEKLDKDKILELIGKYSLVVCHAIINEDKTPSVKLYSKHLTNIFKDGITIEKLETISDGTSLFDIAFNDIKMKSDNYFNSVFEIIDTMKLCNCLNVDSIRAILLTNFHYFNASVPLSQFQKYDNRTRFDLLIPYILNNTKPYLFSVSIDGEEYPKVIENLNQKFDGTKSRNQRNILCLLGFLTDFAIKNNQLDTPFIYFKLKSTRIKVECTYQEAKITPVFDFITPGTNQNKNDYQMKWKIVKPFTYMFNDKKYKISENGISLIQ